MFITPCGLYTVGNLLSKMTGTWHDHFGVYIFCRGGPLTSKHVICSPVVHHYYALCSVAHSLPVIKET